MTHRIVTKITIMIYSKLRILEEIEFVVTIVRYSYVAVDFHVDISYYVNGCDYVLKTCLSAFFFNFTFE